MSRLATTLGLLLPLLPASSAGAHRPALPPPAPRTVEEHLGSGESAMRGGELEHARSEFLAALAAAPELPDVLESLARLETRAGRPEAAMEWWSRLLAVRPEHERALDRRARLLLDAGLPDGALSDLRRLAALRQPLPPRSCVTLARALAACGRAAEARRLLEEAIARQGRVPSLDRALGDLRAGAP